MSENSAEGRDPGMKSADGASDEPSTGERRPDEVRIVALEAAVAAGLVKPGETTAPSPGDPTGAERAEEAGFELPDWTDPPTGQVPKVLLDAGEDPEATHIPGPTWRQSAADWDADEDTLGFLVEEVRAQEEDDDAGAEIAGRGEDPAGETTPFEFDFTPATKRRRLGREDGVPVGRATRQEESGPAPGDDRAWADVVAARRRHRRHAAHRAAKPANEAPRRNTAVALTTGVVLAGIAVACFEVGSLAVLVLAAAVLAIAAGETFGALRSAGYRPASFVGLAAVPAVTVASYLRGPEAVPVVLAAALVTTGVWRIVAGHGSSLDDIATTVLVTVWFGVAGAFAGLMLNPSAYPLRHGVAYVGAAVFLTVAHDVGSFLVGSKLGRHRMVPRVSPGKTVEGFLGGTVLTFVVAAGVVSFVNPFSLGTALGLGAIVAVFAPIGDLFESVVKRDLGLKDMGRLLPAHGGISDRIDALLFVLPATWVLVRLVHIG